MSNPALILVVAPPGKLRRSLQVLLRTLSPTPMVRLTDGDPLGLGLSVAPSLVVWDFRMPASVAWLSALKARWPQTRCLALVDDAAQQRAARAGGADAVLTTGVRAAELAARLTDLMTMPSISSQEQNP